MPLRESRGFTLIEVVVATLVFGLVVLALTGFFIVAAGRGLLGQNVTGGAMLAQQRMEFLRAKGYSSLPGFAGTETLDELGNAVSGGQYTRATTITTPVLGTSKLTQVDVTVNWQEQSATKTVTFSTLRADF